MTVPPPSVMPLLLVLMLALTSCAGNEAQILSAPSPAAPIEQTQLDTKASTCVPLSLPPFDESATVHTSTRY